MEKKQTRGVAVGDTKNKRKFETAWGVVYMPLELVGDETELTFTAEAAS